MSNTSCSTNARRSAGVRLSSAAEAPDRLATLPFIEHELVTFDYIELDDNGPA